MKLHLVPARTGVEWVRLGLRTFWRQPLAFISLFFLFMALISIAAQLPLVGSIVAPVFLPFMTLGLMVATSVAYDSETPKPVAPAMFVAAVRAMRGRWRPMVVLGIISAIYFVAAVGVSALIDGGQLARAYLLDETVTPEIMAGSDFQTARLLVMCLNLPLSLAMWHAPALVHWHGVAPAKSLFFSLVALFRNFTAYAMFCLSWFGVFMIAGIALGLLATVLVAAGGMAVGDSSSMLGGALMIGCALTLAAMSLSSTWFTFRDSFDPD
ncbi:BPSS1780 family membrane protein [Variovorax sp. J22G21]|uniref:BPSS1780 family membrane protein n=1 Tax=Variovorax fucosicus TaxID=3053517 RepID=UPI002578D698|nr:MULTISPECIES: BPSS1780 family membrane protein [unclassified Variovorax]MDM0040373.1 BPSS1780 family membrane protein [Variovorax sp. J22R193]MDM0061746.1 BPSS1780 family membrane protein [Variovorax sp. J22G21]